MKKLITLIVLIIAIVRVHAQGHPDLLEGKVRELFDKGQKCWSEGGENCITFFQSAYHLEKEAKKNCLSCIEVELAKSYTYMGKFDTAQAYLNLAQQSLKKMDYSDKRVKQLDAEIQTNIAMNFYFSGKIDSAILYIKKNIAIIDKIGDKKSSAFAKMNLASIYNVVNDYHSAIQTNLKAYKELEDLKMLDDSRAAVLCGNLATAYHEAGNIDASVIWAKRAIKMGYANKSVAAQFYGNYLMGVNLSKTKPDSSLIFIENAVKLASNSGRPDFISKSKMVKGIVLGEMKKYPEGIKNLSEAVKLMEKNPEDVDYMEAIRNLGMISDEGGEYRLSAKYLKEYVLAKDSLNTAKNQELIHEYQAKYETEKKEKQIAEQALAILKKNEQIRNWSIIGGLLLLGSLIYLYQSRKSQKQKIALLKQENENAILKAIMSSEERERRNISSTLHDSVAAKLGAAKMSLQSIPFLAEERKNEQLEKTAQLISTIHADVRSVAHNLLPVTLEKEGLVPALAEFVSEINQLQLLEIKFENLLPSDFTLPKRNELVLYRIVQELINNVVKHAKASQATVTLSEKGEELEILVSDNGIGFSSTQENQGLYSIRERIHIIGGHFSIESKQELGSVAKLTLNRV